MLIINDLNCKTKDAIMQEVNFYENLIVWILYYYKKNYE